MNVGIDKLDSQLRSQQSSWLITGVAGFIGSNLLEALLKLNQKVIGIDNFFTGYQRNIDEVLRDLPQQYIKNFRFYEIDIRNAKDCEQVMQGVDYVLHQAALGSVPRSINDPLTTNAINVDGFLNVITAAKNNHVKRLVYASSSSVYGDSSILPKVEHCIGSQLSPYAVSKYTNELYAKVFADCYGMEVMGLRYFNVFGQRQDPNGVYAAVIPLWIKSLLAGEEVFINGDGETTRDFCYIANVVQANLLAAFTVNRKALNQVYNIAVGEQTTLNGLFSYMKSLLGIAANVKPTYREFRAGDIRHSLADISKASCMFGYQPIYKVLDGLKEAVGWYINFSKM